MIETLMRLFLEWCAARNAQKCRHPPHEVVADILEGDGARDRCFSRHLCAVQYCRVCGSYRLIRGEISSGWRTPSRAYPADLKTAPSDAA